MIKGDTWGSGCWYDILGLLWSFCLSKRMIYYVIEIQLIREVHKKGLKVIGTDSAAIWEQN